MEKPELITRKADNELVSDYQRSTPLAHRKKYAQYFTPPTVAEFMVNWVTGDSRLDRVLDPAVGLGIFPLLLLENTHPPSQVVGYEVDAHILTECCQRVAPTEHTQLLFMHKDYLLNDWESRFNGIVCNPPYLHFRSYANRPAIISEFQQRLKIPVSRLANLHVLFLLKAVYQLAKGGRAAFIMPSEFLNADYGVAVKEYLVSMGCLKTVVIFDARSTVFDEGLTTSCILLIEKDGKPGPVEFIQVKSPDDLLAIGLKGERNFRSQMIQVDPRQKWGLYYRQQDHAAAESAYHNVVPFSTYAHVKRGIATGYNDFFVFSLSKLKQHGLSEADVLPCVTKAALISSPFFTQDDFETLKEKDRTAFVLNVRQPLSEAASRYLQLGEEAGVHLRFLTRHRRSWYALENRPPAPIWAGVFSRGRLRFIRNEAGIRSLTCFHGVYIHPAYEARIDLLMAYLLTRTCREMILGNRREYGDGLGKYEPNDLNHAMVIDLNAVSQASEEQILGLYQRYRLSVLEKREAADLLEDIDQIFQSILQKG